MATSSGAAGGLSIVVPAYNEAARIGDSLRAVCDYVVAAEVDAEVLVVDDMVKDLIAQKATTLEINRAARGGGKLKTLKEDAAAKLVDGVTTPEEAMAVVVG